MLAKRLTLLVVLLVAACDGTQTEPQEVMAALVRVDVEPVGLNCPAGGSAIRAGLDQNGDGLLEDQEVRSIQFACRAASTTSALGKGGSSPTPWSSMVVAVSPVPPGPQCAAGGQALRLGTDLNANGVLDESEVTQTEYVCNGAAGTESAAGATSLVVTRPEAPGASCPAGGVLVLTGVDSNGDGVLTEVETSRSEYVCNGPAGAAGLSIASSISPEPSGANCPTGGQAVNLGPDLNANGFLERDEIATTEYVCNGLAGAPGAQGDLSLVVTRPELPGANCSAGGSVIASGVDADGDAALDDAEISHTEYVCNGTPGLAGATSLVVVQPEPPGTNCPAGGVAVLTGVEQDRDGLLAASETVSTAYLCKPQPVLVVSRGEVAFVAVEGGADPEGTSVFVLQAGGVAVGPAESVVSYSGAGGWLAASLDGTTLSLDAHGTGLPAGFYSATVDLSAPAALNSPQQVLVTFVIQPRAEMALSTTKLWFHASSRKVAPEPQHVWLSSVNGAPFSAPRIAIRTEDGGDWLRAAVSGWASPYLVTFQPSTSMPAGRYRAVVTFTTDEAPEQVNELEVALQLDRDVVVSCADTFWDQSSPTVVPTYCDVSAYVRDDDGSERGTWAQCVGDCSTRLLPGVPPGPYDLQVNRAAPRNGDSGWTGTIRTSAGALDLGRDYGGRAPVQYPWSYTPVTFNLSGLLPWSSGTDALQYFYGGLTWGYFDPTSLADGATVAPNELFDWSWDPRRWYSVDLPLLVPSDVLYLAQQRQSEIPGAADRYRSVASWGSATGIGMANGTPVTIAMTLSEPAEVASPSVDWRTSGFEAAIPPGDQGWHSLTFAAMPFPSDGDFPASTSVDLAEVSIDATAPVADRHYDALPFGRFLPQEFREFSLATFSNSVTRTAADGVSYSFTQRVDHIDLLTGPGVSAAPLVSCVRNPRIAGRDALVAHTDVGSDQNTDPNWARVPLTWDPPEAGTPTKYAVTLYRISPWGRDVLRRLITTGTSMLVDVSRGDFPLVAVIQAEQSAGGDAESHPFRTRLPYGRASLATAPFSWSW